MIKAIIFDFDGTLADTELITLRAVNKYAARFKYKKVRDREKLRHKEGIEVLTKELGIPMWKLPYIAWKAKQLAKKELREAHLFPEIKKTVDELKKDYLIIVVTSNHKQLVEYVFKKDNLELENVHSSTFFTKNIRLLWVMKRFRLKKEECIYIGDEIRDVKACKHVGMNMIGVSWGYNSAEALKKAGAEVIADSPKEILDIIKKMKANRMSNSKKEDHLNVKKLNVKKKVRNIILSLKRKTSSKTRGK